MSKFKETLDELYLTGYFSDIYLVNSLTSQYNKSSLEKQAALNKHALLVLDDIVHSKYKENISSINNILIAFICLAVLSAIISIIAALNS